MNREIKFRAWDVAENMTYFELNPITLLKGVSSHLKSIIKQEEGYELMQYTGLKDKNGVEIYEGDVISRTDVYTNLIQTVTFAHGKFIAWNRTRPKEGKWLSDNGKSYDLNFLLTLNKDWEIIGNIHQNPDLLT